MKKHHKIQKYILFFSVLSILHSTFYILLPPISHAVCPICTVAVIGGLGLSRYLGIDDAVSGIWIGGLIISSAFWFADWIQKKKPILHTAYYILLSVTLMVLFVFIPLHYSGITGHPFNKILGIDKLIFGSIVGAITFLLGVFADKKVREVKGHQLFIYQKVVFPISALVISSLLMYFYGGYLNKL
jgi:hypothetical protein